MLWGLRRGAKTEEETLELTVEGRIRAHSGNLTRMVITQKLAVCAGHGDVRGEDLSQMVPLACCP